MVLHSLGCRVATRATLHFGDRSKSCVMSKDSPQAFDGSGNLLSFLDRVSVWTSLKEYDEKKRWLLPRDLKDQRLKTIDD